MQEMKVGTVEGGASSAAVNVSLGWLPDKVVLYNIDDATALNPKIEWTYGMTSGGGLMYLTSGATAGEVNATLLTTSGVARYAGTAALAAGFTINVNAHMNVSGETIVYEAYRTV